MMTAYVQLVTDFGDSAVTGAFSLITAAYLLVHKQRRAAAAMVGAFSLAAFCIALGKIALYSRCHPLTDAIFDLRSPSGHTAVSIAVYGTFAVIVASSIAGWRKILPHIFMVSLVMGIAISRIALGSHTPGDVVAGAGIGSCVEFFVWRFFLKGQRVQCPWLLFVIGAIVVVTALNGLHFPAEGIINHFSNLIRKHLVKCS